MRCGSSTGFVASGTFSPILAAGIGTGYVSPDPGNATDVLVNIRGRKVDAGRVEPPLAER